MSDTITKPKIKDKVISRPANSSSGLRAGFHMREDQAMRVLMTAHRRGAYVVAVSTKDMAEAKATSATDAGRSKGYPLLFTTEPEE